MNTSQCVRQVKLRFLAVHSLGLFEIETFTLDSITFTVDILIHSIGFQFL